jgi:EDD domain protein, DegV family
LKFVTGGFYKNNGGKQMFEIITDSTANLTDDIIGRYAIKIISWVYRIGNDDYKSYENGRTTDVRPFYERMRKGEAASTAQMTRHVCREAFEEILKAGSDLLYIGFSSALSGSFDATVMVADELRGEYPDRKIYVVDSKAASMGQGLLVYHAALLRSQGKEIDETKQWLDNNILRLCHWFTVDDLMYLKRGGRISPTTALVGTLMGIKPILHVDDEGRLVSVGKVRGRRHSVEELFSNMKRTCEDADSQVIFIGHGDCPDDAEYLESLVRAEYKVKDVVINYIDPVIGAHSGPGTLALFFLGSKR